MAYVNLGKMPSHAREYVVDFPQLDGGLNLQELDYRIKNDETPEMKNLWWKDGLLCCRDGQVWISEDPIGVYHASYSRLWNGKMLLHAGNKLCAVDPLDGAETVLFTGNSNFNVGGTFFPYNEKMYYKTKGYYIEVVYDGGTDTFSASEVEGYIPVTYISCSYTNGAGTIYQPENRISSKKTLWYNSAYTLTVTPSGTLTAIIEAAAFRMKINTPGTYTFTYSSGWKLNGEAADPLDYGISVSGTPASGNTLVVKYGFVTEYYLPEKNLDVTKVEVEGVNKAIESKTVTVSKSSMKVTIDDYAWRAKVTTSGTYMFVYDGEATPSPGWRLNGTLITASEYGLSVTASQLLTGDTITIKYTRGECWYDPENGIVGFYTAPNVYYPEITNTVHITYSKENALAEKNVMDCTIAEVYGGTGALCIVMAGSEDQPNAYFWNGQNSISMDPSYFPMIQYQLAGDAVDPITAFGKQQGFLIIFKKGSIGRTSLGTETVNERMTIDLPYVNINAKIGCDLPKSIQLIENNLTWCNTSQGVHFLANTSSAYENNVVCISQKVNTSNSSWTMGLLNDVQRCDPILVTSHDDEYRYWLVADGHVWLWDYNVSNYKNPAWFYFENVKARGIVQEENNVWHFDTLSRLTKFGSTYSDYDGAIDKVYRFTTQYFGTYDRKKNVNSVIINLRSSTDSVVKVRYLTDYEERDDLTDLRSLSWSLVPRDLSFRNLEGTGFSKTFRRKPHCRRVQYFTMRLENNTPRMDLAVVSAQIYYIYQGGQR